MRGNFFKGLNSQQKNAVETTEGKVRIIAGAGSGKTRVLTNRYIYLTEYIGIDPANILCMTFTNKAAHEMRNRIRKMVPLENVNDYICTIHGLCVKILRKEIFRIGYPQNFMIIDMDDCNNLMKQVMHEQNIDKNDITIKQLLSKVRSEKYKQDSSYISYLLPDAVWTPNLEKSPFLRYLQLQNKYYALDFDDLICLTLFILHKYEDARDYWQKEFDYIQVDEVQDCSRTDWEIINLLSEKCGNLFVVGDPDQAIYEWRGAKPDFFLNFKADVDIILDENYRSTPNILNVANSIIKNNINRIKKDLRTNIPSSARVIYKHAKNEKEESEWVSSEISKRIKLGAKPDDFAILYRASNQSRFIEQSLMEKQLPYTIWGGIRFFERREIKDCIAYLRLVDNKDDISFKRVINVPSRKFGKVKMEALEKIAEEENLPLFDTLRKHINEAPFNILKDFMKEIDSFEKYSTNHTISDVLNKILNDTGLSDMYRKDVNEERLENINELMNSIRYYEESNYEDEVSLAKYLQDVALYTNMDYKSNTSTVKLMTVHQSKGLEFPYVFIVGLTEGVFPSYKTLRERRLNGLEEERRLMYVAVTRAENVLYLTESEGYNFISKSDKYPSRFISEISKKLLNMKGHVDSSLIYCRDTMIDRLDYELREDEYDFYEGDKVSHEKFGRGTILSVNNERKSCEIEFGDKRRNIQWKFLEKI